MRKILLLAVGLVLVLAAIINIQRMLVMAMTKRPFLGTWTEDARFFAAGPPSHIQFDRGGDLWITRFGEARRLAHWEDGTRPQEIVLMGIDPALPKARESYHWYVTPGRFMLFPMPPPGTRRWILRSTSASILNHSYTRASRLAWPASPSFVGRWVSSFERPHLRLRRPAFRPPTPRRVLLDVQPDGKLWLYQEGQPRRRGGWTAEATGRTFAMVVDPSGGSSRDTWYGRIVQNVGGNTRIDFGFRRPVNGGRPAPRYPADYIGELAQISDAPADQRPFLGTWRPRFTSRQFQLEMLRGGKLRMTEANGPTRRGTWTEAGPLPRLTLTGMDPEHPERATEWYWAHGNTVHYPVHAVGGGELVKVVPELLELFAVGAVTTDRRDGTELVLERLHSPSAEMHKHPVSTRP